MASDFDFGRLAPRCGSQVAAFEELCCQLASRVRPADTNYARLRGAGGDGGVECYVDLPGGSRIGWQAKYLFDINDLLVQATQSLHTAMAVHANLTRYVICFPFDLTGSTRRRARSGVEKFEEWREEQVRLAASQGRIMKILAWPAASLRSLLLQLDTSGGLRGYFFDETVLSPDWFLTHLRSARATAGPRYTPELNVATTVGGWFSALGRTAGWLEALERLLKEADEKQKQLAEAVTRESGDRTWPDWPAALRDNGLQAAERAKDALDACAGLEVAEDERTHERCLALLDDARGALAGVARALADDLETGHGRGTPDSPGFRQFMAEYQVSFPAANLDHVREARAAFGGLEEWLRSPEGQLAFRAAFVLSGGWGVGKTHAACDVAHERLKQGLLTCVVFGHQFRGEPDPWTRLAESLGLPPTMGKDKLLDALNAAGESSGQPLLLIVDAINETRPLQYWRDRLSSFLDAVRTRPHLRVCVTCRTPFLAYSLPDAHGLPIVEHPGFRGIEHVACAAFFQHYGLQPPIAPILQPELSNPLYLKLVCETIKAQGLSRMPSGWASMGRVVEAFLEEKEGAFAREHDLGAGARIVTGSLQCIARAMAELGQSVLSRSQASNALQESRLEPSPSRVVEWLVREDLLIEEAPDASGGFGAESSVRLAFERLGDFMVASQLLERVAGKDLEDVLGPAGELHHLVRDEGAVGENSGVLSALSIMIPESKPGAELPHLVGQGPSRKALVEIVMASLPGRDPSSLTPATREMVVEALHTDDLSRVTMDAVLSTAWQPSAIDAVWLHGFLDTIPLARRDAWWCGYLHQSYEASGPVRRLIDGAIHLAVDEVDQAVAERWATLLAWFAAAADRRVKDWATRALVRLLVAHRRGIIGLLGRFIGVDDDEVRERLILAGYGALLLRPDLGMVTAAAEMLQAAFRREPASFDNALMRDHLRCFAELAIELGAAPDSLEVELTTRPISSEWPLHLPSDDEVKRWSDAVHFAPDEFTSDFFKYSMYCLRPWEHALPKKDMGKWILQRVARDLAYMGSGAEDYDNYMLGKYGGGRAKPKWVERIGKKYQWIAMYQLASRLNDHIVRGRDSWEPEPLRAPLILLEERKLDPTLAKVSLDDSGREPWWIAAQVDLRSVASLDDAEWAAKEDDIPSLPDLLSVIERGQNRWRVLVAYPTWGRRGETGDEDAPYRQVWMHIQSYLVPNNLLSAAYDSIHRRNFFGRWMPEGASWLYGFVGEYPWGTAYNTERDEWHGRGGSGKRLPPKLTPAWNEVVAEWEYDASLPESLCVTVPARAFLDSGGLWWDGEGAYRTPEGRVTFLDPHVTGGSPKALLASADELPGRLSQLG